MVNHLSLLVTFNDGTQGKVTIVPQWLTGVFAELLQPETFKTVFVEYGAVTWENGLDLEGKEFECLDEYKSCHSFCCSALLNSQSFSKLSF
ncbi:DUF2442 domain-containing protein, partial [Vibrio mediterranei]|uniref:DUF2442 domain-containing protein n=1 Tax=Vibrio mediterranei TaxID=689 RepID=UPI00148B6782